MLEALEDYKLYIEAEKRMKNSNEQDFISEEDVMNSLGITQENLDAVDDVELE